MLPEWTDRRMVELNELIGYADTLLDVGRFQDYTPNGLQVEGREEVRRIVSGVTASQAFIDAALNDKADLLLVHHGFFWRGENPRIINTKARRLGALLRAEASLAAYHLPLDAHPEIGNNACLAVEMGWQVDGRFGPEEIALFGAPHHTLSGDQMFSLLETRLCRRPLHVAAEGRPIRRIGWCSGAAQDYLEQAAELGLDAYVSGEISERTFHMAREWGIHYFAAGHHATERLGVKALGEHLADRFGLEHLFVDIPNPV